MPVGWVKRRSATPPASEQVARAVARSTQPALGHALIRLDPTYGWAGRMILQVESLDLFYGDAQALDGVSLVVEEGELVAIVGANGAGKSSLIRTIAGIERPRAGAIRFRGHDIAGQPSHRICDLGIGQVAEGRQIFPSLTVEENLEMGALLPARAAPCASRWPRSRRCSPGLPSAATSPPAPCRAASSRCSPSAAA